MISFGIGRKVQEGFMKSRGLNGSQNVCSRADPVPFKFAACFSAVLEERCQHPSLGQLSGPTFRIYHLSGFSVI